jgi:adenylate cyclase
MPRVHILPDDRVVQADAEESLLDASLRAGAPHTHICGGTARCSTCRVHVGGGRCTPRTAAEERIARRLGFGPEIRLACQTRALQDVDVRRLVLDREDVRLTDQSLPNAASRAVGTQKQVAVLFADIRGFTTFAETLPPYDVVHSLSRYFHRMDVVVRAHGGYIDNYMGDGLMALFGTDDEPDAAWRAVEAGLDMLAAVDALAPYFESIYAQRIHIGIGIHFGEVVMGTVTPPGTDKVTAIGDTVNTAARIEAANKALGTSLLISEPTYERVAGRLRCRRHDDVALPGKKGLFTLYEVLDRQLRDDARGAGGDRRREAAIAGPT